MLRRLLPAVLASCLAAPLASQRTPSVWVELGTVENARISIDSAYARRLAPGTFSLGTQTRFPEPVGTAAGERYDRRIDFQQIDCTHQRVMGLLRVTLRGDSVVGQSRPRGGWRGVPEGEQPLLRLRCEYLVRVFTQGAGVGAAPPQPMHFPPAVPERRAVRVRMGAP
jgi:hypothetical protein